MKTFINKKTDIAMSPEDSTKLGYANLAMIGLNTPPQGGWTPDEMRQRIKVISKLDDQDLEAEIELEDAEFELVVQCARIKWQFMHKDVVAFDDYLSELKKE